MKVCAGSNHVRPALLIGLLVGHSGGISSALKCDCAKGFVGVGVVAAVVAVLPLELGGPLFRLADQIILQSDTLRDSSGCSPAGRP